MSIPLDGLRALVSPFRPSAATIQRVTETSTGDGTTSSWATVATVMCRVSRIGQGGTENTGAGGGIQAIGQRRIKLPPGTDVTAKDRIVVGGVTYEVADVPKIDNEVERMAICREVT